MKQRSLLSGSADRNSWDQLWSLSSLFNPIQSASSLKKLSFSNCEAAGEYFFCSVFSCTFHYAVVRVHSFHWFVAVDELRIIGEQEIQYVAFSMCCFMYLLVEKELLSQFCKVLSHDSFLLQCSRSYSPICPVCMRQIEISTEHCLWNTTMHCRQNISHFSKCLLEVNACGAMPTRNVIWLPVDDNDQKVQHFWM